MDGVAIVSEAIKYAGIGFAFGFSLYLVVSYGHGPFRLMHRP